MAEKTANRPKTRKFKAEVSQLLSIVINSLYTDKEIFVRELISNASDACEKLRRVQLTEKETVVDEGTDLEIRIHLDEEAGSFTITDTGVGMTPDEAAENLGTIAHSGSREFLKALEESGGDVDAKTLIGQFGVGFYSAFMAADKVTVHSRSYQKDAPGVVWESNGAGSYSLRETEDLPRGTTITVQLKEDSKQFADAEMVKQLIKRYSNFVSFPIKIEGEQVNTVAPLWTKPRNEISDEELTEFYRFTAAAHDEPTYTIHFAADAPLAIRSLLFVPGSNMERFGVTRYDEGIDLYCRRVLISSQAEELLPEWLRFVEGVVDSEDLPLNISRETMQDSALIAKIKKVLSGRILKTLREELKSEREKYEAFFSEFGAFLKEGVASDFSHRDDIAKLLLFRSSREEGSWTTLGEYLERMGEQQQAIYYITGPDRESIEAGPYIEALAEHGFEVLYLHEGIDDFVMNALREYEDKPLISADQADLKLPGEDKSDDDSDEDKEADKDEADSGEAGELARWIKEQLADAVEEVRVSKRLVKSPALLVNPDEYFTTGMRRVMQQSQRESMPLGKMILEINPEHAILKRLGELRSGSAEQQELAADASKLLLDNAQIAAGLLVDPKSLVQRSTRILQTALGAEETGSVKE